MKQSWDIEIARADELASKSDGAKELILFYGKLLRVQKEMYEYLCSRRGWLPSGRLEQDLPIIRVMMPRLLVAVESSGPAALAEEAKNLLQTSEAEIDDMILEYWLAPSGEQFFAKAFLQPYVRWLAETQVRPIDRTPRTAQNHCPFCAGKPQLTLLQEAGSEAGGRSMLCSTCLMVWPYRRVVCANCDEERPAKLGYFHSPEFEKVRVEACDTCKHYIKGIELTPFGLATPLVDEVAAAPLDLWARDHGYTKIEINLVGL